VRSKDQTAADLVRPAGFEPATRCLEGTVGELLHVAWCRSMGRSAALMIADHGPVLPENWGCWLPIWLPELARLSVVRMSENSIGCAAADGVLLVCSAPNLTCSRHRRRPRKRAASPRRALAASMTPGPGARMQVVRRGADASDLALSVRHHVHSGMSL